MSLQHIDSTAKLLYNQSSLFVLFLSNVETVSCCPPNSQGVLYVYFSMCIRVYMLNNLGAYYPSAFPQIETRPSILPHGLIEMIYYLGSQFIQPDSVILDLASHGDVLGPFICSCSEDVSFVAVNHVKESYSESQQYARTTVMQNCDLSHDYPRYRTSLTLSVFALQHMDVSSRQRTLRNAFNQTQPGGAFILVEKVLNESFDLTDSMKNTALSLHGDYREPEGFPLTPHLHEAFMKSAGFGQVECFYKSLDLAAWIAIVDGVPAYQEV